MSCQFLFTEFNATAPVQLWIFPPTTGYVFHNGTPYFYPTIYWYSGIVESGKIAIQITGTAYASATANPYDEPVTVYVSQETEPCR